MRDPVVDPEGNTYERSAIENWLSRSQTSPITRSFLTVAMLNPNRALVPSSPSARCAFKIEPNAHPLQLGVLARMESGIVHDVPLSTRCMTPSVLLVKAQTVKMHQNAKELMR